MGIKRTSRSRYSLMESSNVLDEVTGEAYPDILTARYQDFIFSKTPQRVQLTLQYKDKPFLLNFAYYGATRGDDILLDLNLVPHVEYLEPGMVMYMPNVTDMEDFIKRKTTRERRKI